MYQLKLLVLQSETGIVKKNGQFKLETFPDNFLRQNCHWRYFGSCPRTTSGDFHPTIT